MSKKRTPKAELKARKAERIARKKKMQKTAGIIALVVVALVVGVLVLNSLKQP